MKSYPLQVHDQFKIMAFETVVNRHKTVFLGFTISRDINMVSELGQHVLNTIAAATEQHNGTLIIVEISRKKTAKHRLKEAVRRARDGDALLVVAWEDGISAEAVKLINCQSGSTNTEPAAYRLPDDFVASLSMNWHSGSETIH